MDKKHKIYGTYWLQEDMLPQIDDRAVGLISNSLQLCGRHRHAGEQGVRRRLCGKHKRLPSWFAESAYTAGLWTKTAIDSINGNVEDREAFLKAMRTVQIKAPRGPLKLDAYDNPIQNVYVAEGREDQASGARRRADQQAGEDLRGRVAVLDLEARGVPRARPYKR